MMVVDLFARSLVCVTARWWLVTTWCVVSKLCFSISLFFLYLARARTTTEYSLCSAAALTHMHTDFSRARNRAKIPASSLLHISHSLLLLLLFEMRNVGIAAHVVEYHTAAAVFLLLFFLSSPYRFPLSLQ